MGIIRRRNIKENMAAFVSVNVWIFLTLICLLATLYDTHAVRRYHDFYVIAILLPVLILAGLYGYFVSMISFVICFIACLIFSADQAYSLAVFLNALFVYSLFSQYYWFSSILKTFGATVLNAISSSLMALLCYTVVEYRDYNISVVLGVGK